ncbi:hypothetical protein Clacol_005446 [Clathrus columnatus]|uniref:VLRF1 domain-containing protein n=1 Tax=Clathrus columnatus TaxID=1419009 RepID=A0AAV5AEU3_9AGAM|nr:hypothetical protein Clacol_005446 [Clathrus columnatus]
MSYHVFSLPKELLDTLTPRTLVPPRNPSPPPLPKTFVPSNPTGSKSCNVCLGSAFADVDDQRVHFKSDWHRYNVKLRLRGENAVTEPRFSSLIEGLEDSLSGSASSSDEESDDQTPDSVRALLQKSQRSQRPSSPNEDIPQIARNPIIWFHSPPSTQIGVYRLLFPRDLPQTQYLSGLKDMQNGGPYGRRWLMLMVAGGHFAGMIAQVCRPHEDEPEEEVSNKKKKKRKPQNPKTRPEIEVLKHKTFHRYTTRRKQGGSQSVNDNAKGPAKSAGALLRRYGEQALRDVGFVRDQILRFNINGTQDIRNLMAEWAEEISACEMIWIRASVSNKRIFYDYEEAIFQKDDERLRNFPFPTRRPTLSELSRCLNELTRVKVSHLTEDELRSQDEAYLASLPKPKAAPIPLQQPIPVPKVTAPQLTKEEEVRLEKWDRLTEMVTKGRLDAFKDLWDREGSQLGGINCRMSPNEVTLLHVSASVGQEEITRYILEELRADPTIPVLGSHEDDAEYLSDASDAPPPVSAMSRRVAYDLAKTRAVRNVFRRCAASYPDWWDWLGAARIPSVLSQEMEEERDGRKKQRRKGLKDKIRERQSRQVDAQPTVEPEPEVELKVVQPQAPATGPRRLGGVSGAQESVTGLSSEMRAKVERERRARAAEARLKALEGR